jgi:hypothetical protein
VSRNRSLQGLRRERVRYGKLAVPLTLQPRLSLAFLTALNFFNYIDRSVLFAVQPLVKQEFHSTEAKSRISDDSLLLRLYVHRALLRVVGRPLFTQDADHPWCDDLERGDSSDSHHPRLSNAAVPPHPCGYRRGDFATIASSRTSSKNATVGASSPFFALANPAGTALGYVLGGLFGQHYGWRSPFTSPRFPAFLLVLAFLFIGEPEKGTHRLVSGDSPPQDAPWFEPQRRLLDGHIGNRRDDFALGGLSVWMPTFLSRAQDLTPDRSQERPIN